MSDQEISKKRALRGDLINIPEDPAKKETGTTQLDILADELEKKGFIREAYEIDIIANTLEMEGLAPEAAANPINFQELMDEHNISSSVMPFSEFGKIRGNKSLPNQGISSVGDIEGFPVVFQQGPANNVNAYTKLSEEIYEKIKRQINHAYEPENLPQVDSKFLNDISYKDDRKKVIGVNANNFEDVYQKIKAIIDSVKEFYSVSVSGS